MPADPKTGTNLSARSVGNRRLMQSAGSLDPGSPPKGLRQEAKDAWRYAIENAPEGALAATDASILERWARTWALYRKVARSVEDSDVVDVNDKGVYVVSAQFTAMIKLQQQLTACEAALGFTPVARGRVRAPASDDQEANPFLEE